MEPNPDTTLAGVRGRPSTDGSDDTLRADATVAGSSTSLSRGDSLGRYLILRELGAGAMGVVYSAHDRELGREVAVKVLRTATGDPEGPARMLREAQALARLAHPNVVTIHDVGSDRGRGYITMELIDGQTLREWLSEAPRSWRAIVAVILDAARGLAAAHGKGLVHRDFKPDNVMCGRDGRVRVMDFGLARGVAHGAAGSSAAQALATSPSTIVLTATGAVAGTPAYMSSEQWGGAVAGPASDQFALCATAWEALTGARPFRGENVHALCAAVCRGVIDESPPTNETPRWLRRVLARGLRVDPAERWPSVDALVAEIEGRLRKGRTLRWSIGVIGVVAATAGLGQWQAGAEGRRREACRADALQIGSIWNDGARTTLATAMHAGGAEYAAASSTTVANEIDRWSRSWIESAERACVAAGEPENAVWESARVCLADQSDRLQLALDLLGGDDSLAVMGAVDVVNDLPDPVMCASPAVVSRQQVSAPSLRDEALGVRRAMLDASLRLASGDGLAARALTEDAIARAEAIDVVPLAAEARIIQAEALEAVDDFDGMITVLEKTHADASSAGAIEVAADAARLLAFAHSQYRANPEAARAWAAASAAALGPTATDDLRRTARLQHVRALIAADEGDIERALELFDAVLELHREGLGDGHPSVGATLGSMSTIYASLGRFDRAESTARRALEIFEAAYGASHPLVADGLHRVGLVVAAQGRTDEALTFARRALAILERSLGPDARGAAYVHMAMGSALLELGDGRGALASLQRAAELLEAKFGREHSATTSALNNLGNAHHFVGEPQRAVALYREVVAIRTKLFGPGHPEVASALHNLGDTLSTIGQLDEAGQVLEEARRILDARRPLRVVLMLRVLTGLATVHRAQGRLADARAALERALALEDLGAATSPLRTQVLVMLAEVFGESSAAGQAEPAAPE